MNEEFQGMCTSRIRLRHVTCFSSEHRKTLTIECCAFLCYFFFIGFHFFFSLFCVCVFFANLFYDYSAGVQQRSEGKLWPTATAGSFKSPSNQSPAIWLLPSPAGRMDGRTRGLARGYAISGYRAGQLADWLTDWPTGPLMTFYIAKEAMAQTKTLNQNQTSKPALIENARLSDAL